MRQQRVPGASPRFSKMFVAMHIAVIGLLLGYVVWMNATAVVSDETSSPPGGWFVWFVANVLIIGAIAFVMHRAWIQLSTKFTRLGVKQARLFSSSFLQ